MTCAPLSPEALVATGELDRVGRPVMLLGAALVALTVVHEVFRACLHLMQR